MPATLAERTALEGLQLRASLSNPGDREAILANPDAIAIPPEQFDNGWVFVAEEDGIVLGFAAVYLRDDGDFELDGLFVEPTLWRSGVGRRLVQHSALFSREAGAKALHVIGNPHAEGFYLSCGFEVLGRGDTRFGPSILMRLSV